MKKKLRPIFIKLIYIIKKSTTSNLAIKMSSNKSCSCSTEMFVLDRCKSADGLKFWKCPARIETLRFELTMDLDSMKEMSAERYDNYQEVIKAFYKKKYYFKKLGGVKREMERLTELFVERSLELDDLVGRIETIKEYEEEKKEKKRLANEERKKCDEEDDAERQKGGFLPLGESFPDSDDFEEWVMRETSSHYRIKEMKKEEEEEEDKLKELYGELDDEYAEYFKGRYFNRFQFRYGRKVQACLWNNYDYTTFVIVKSTKTYVEAYPIWKSGKCGDVRKFNKPSDFARFVWE